MVALLKGVAATSAFFSGLTMNHIISCDSCKTSLSLSVDVKPDAKIKCPKCGHYIGNPIKTALAEEQMKASSRPKPSQANSWSVPAPVFLIPPFGSILITLLALLVPVFVGQYWVTLVFACLAMLVSIAGLALLVFGKSRPISVHLAGAAVSCAAIFLAINALMLKSSIETNEDHGTHETKLRIRENHRDTLCEFQVPHGFWG